MGQDKVTPVEKTVWEGRERNGQEFLLLTSEDVWGGPGGSPQSPNLCYTRGGGLWT